MNPEVVVALLVALLGTAGLAGITKALSGFQRPARMRARVEADLELAALFPVGDRARDALLLSARVRAIDLATLALVRVGRGTRVIRRVGMLLFALGLYVMVSESYSVWLKMEIPFNDFVTMDDLQLPAEYWFGFAISLLGWGAILATFNFVGLYQPEIARVLHGAGAEAIPRELLPLEVAPYRQDANTKKLLDKSVRISNEADWNASATHSASTELPRVPNRTRNRGFFWSRLWRSRGGRRSE